MNGNNIVADTSLLVNFFNGYEVAKKALVDQRIWISCITEIELLSFPGLPDNEKHLLRSFIDQCTLIEWDKSVRQLTIDLRSRHRLKVPDAIIAASSIHLDFPLVTMDNDFNQIEELNAVILSFI